MFGTRLTSPSVKRRFCGWKHSDSSLSVQVCEAKPSSINAISIGRLVDAKRIALRRGVWFRALSRIERGVVDLTMRYVDDIKSTMLAKVLMVILDKLALASESIAERLVRTVGVSLAQKMSSIAVGWGNHSASKWAADRGYARYLALCCSSKLAVT